MSACINTMQPNLSHTVYFMCVVTAAMVTITPHFVLALSKSSDSNNNNNTKDRNFYRANSPVFRHMYLIIENALIGHMHTEKSHLLRRPF